MNDEEHEEIQCECGSKAFKVTFEQDALSHGMQVFIDNSPEYMVFTCIVCGMRQEKS